MGAGRCIKQAFSQGHGGGNVIYGFNAEEVFQIAIDIEENGYEFYQKAQAVIGDPAVKKIFSSLAEAEIKHKERFTALKAELPQRAKEGTVWDPNNEMDHYLRMMADMHVFKTKAGVKEAVARIKGAVDALKFAIQFEKDSVTFFLTMQDATEEKQGRALIGQLVEEEKGHLRRLALELDKHGGA